MNVMAAICNSFSGRRSFASLSRAPLNERAPAEEAVLKINCFSYTLVVGWRSCLTQCRTVTEVKHGRARSGVGWVTAQVIDQ